MYLEKSKWVIIWDGGSTFLKYDLQKGNKQEITNFATSLMPPFTPSVSGCFWTNYLCSIFLSFNHPWTCSSLPCSLLDPNSTIEGLITPFTPSVPLLWNKFHPILFLAFIKCNKILIWSSRANAIYKMNGGGRGGSLPLRWPLKRIFFHAFKHPWTYSSPCSELHHRRQAQIL